MTTNPVRDLVRLAYHAVNYDGGTPVDVEALPPELRALWRDIAARDAHRTSLDFPADVYPNGFGDL